MTNAAIQMAIGFSGAIAIVFALSADRSRQRLAPIIGLLGQPFWLIATFQAMQWGMFSVSVAYTFVWAWALWREWA
jgi:hypothetical protein